jgi:GH43 family beta-xylosidase
MEGELSTMTKDNEHRILVYTRKPNGDYTSSLSNSIHFAYSGMDGEFVPANRNYGILFPEATVNERNVILEKGVLQPYLFRTSSGGFGIIAVRVAAEGKDDEESKGCLILWTSDDLIDFTCHGLVRLHPHLFVREASCAYFADDQLYEILWRGSDGQAYRSRIADLLQPEGMSVPVPVKEFQAAPPLSDLEGIYPGNCLTVKSDSWQRFCAHWTPLRNTELYAPAAVKAASQQELDEVMATAVYSDGSTAAKRVLWDSSDIDFSTPGTYTVKGKALHKKYPFPLASGFADPVIMLWEDTYYYLATNDNNNNIGFYVRESPSIEGLFEPGYKEALILDINEEKGFIQTFWAPEFHWIGGELYILFAVGGRQWGPQCHMMKLKKGGAISNPLDWEEPVRVKRRDGSFLAEDGITLDMTYFKADGVSCVLWSYRKGIGTPLDTGSMIYIATIEENNPAILTSEPVLLTRPLLGWENIQGTINNEGPYPLITKDHVYIAYSGGAAGGYTYAVGLLSIPRGGDFLDADAWRKAGTPVLSYYSANGVYGPGHNSFFRDADGEVMMLYHGEKELVKSGTRCTAMHRVHFNAKGEPVFDVIGENDLKAELCELFIEVEVG